MRRKKSKSVDERRVFVSHASADRWVAQVICEKIEEAGAVPWIDDRGLNGGDEITDTIRREIVRSHELVVLITPHSVKREWVLSEVSAAWGRRSDYRIIPILYHVTVDEIPAIIRNRKAYDLNDFDRYLAELRRRTGK